MAGRREDMKDGEGVGKSGDRYIDGRRRSDVETEREK